MLQYHAKKTCHMHASASASAVLTHKMMLHVGMLHEY